MLIRPALAVIFISSLLLPGCLPSFELPWITPEVTPTPTPPPATKGTVAFVPLPEVSKELSLPESGLDGKTLYLGHAADHTTQEDAAKTPSLDFGKPVYAATTMASDGTCYALTVDGALYAFNPDGTQRWASSADGRSLFVPHEDGLYVAPQLRSLSAEDGSQQWSVSFDPPYVDELVPAPDGTIYVHVWDYAESVARTNLLYAVSPTGTILWTYDPGPDTVRIAINSEGALVVASSSQLTVLNSNGTVRWTYDTAGSVPVLGSDGAAYVNMGNKILAFAPDGTIRWSFDTASAYPASCLTVGSNHVIYVGTREGNFVALAEDGAEKWRQQFTPSGSPLFGPDGSMYIHKQAGPDILQAFGPDGSVKASFETPWGHHAEKPLFDSVGRLYVLCWSPGFIPPDAPLEPWDGPVPNEISQVYVLNPDGTVYGVSPQVENPIYRVAPRTIIGEDGAIYLVTMSNLYRVQITDDPTPVASDPIP